MPLAGWADVFYVSPDGTGDGVSSPCNLAFAKSKLYDATLTEVELRFAPGTYTLTTDAAFASPYGSPGYGPTKIALIGQPFGTNPAGECILKWADNVVADPLVDDATKQHVMTGAHLNLELDRFVIENMTLDGNFLGQGNVVGPHYREGYKSAAIMVKAKTGRIRNCLIKNFGSRGWVPESWNSVSGVEAFPILIAASDSTAEGSDWPQTGQATDTHAWVVEENEICQLHFPHAGYATAIALNAFIPVLDTNGDGVPDTYPADSPQNRVAAIRRNVVRGVPIAFGAGAPPAGFFVGRVKVEDNVVLNCGLGFNTDTGAIRELDFRNNLFLDVVGVGVFGQAGIAQGSTAHHAHLRITDNTVRLRGRSLSADLPYATSGIYRDFYGQAAAPYAISDPTLDLWRPYRAITTGLLLQGIAENIIMTGNRFATWASGGGASADNKFLSVPYPLPVTTGDGWWYPSPNTVPADPTVEPNGPNWWNLIFPCVSPTSPYVKFSDGLYARYRAAAITASLSNNKLSLRPFDFELSGSAIATENLAAGVQLTTSNAPQHSSQRTPVAATSSHFQPQGFIGRVAPVWDVDTDVLVAAVEVAIDQVDYNPSLGRIKVRARVAEHRTPSTLAPTLVRRSYDTVRLRFVGSSEIPGAWDDPANSGVGANMATYDAVTDANGYAEFTITTGVPTHFGGLIVPRVWVDGDDSGKLDSLADVSPAIPNPPTFTPARTAPELRNRVARASFQHAILDGWDEARDAWAQARLRVGRNYKGSTTAPYAVEVTTQPDVANEKSGKRAKLMFTRLVSGTGSSTLTVNFSLPTTGTGIVRPGTYGTSGSADYYFNSSSVATSLQPNSWSVNAGTGTIEFKADQFSAVLEVIARSDDNFERETAYLQLTSGTGYVPAGRTKAEVILYDGPTWTVLELSSVVWDSWYGMYRQPLATKAWALNHETSAKIAGYARYPANSGIPTDYDMLGWWPASAAGQSMVGMSDLFSSSGTDQWFGLSTTTPTLVGMKSNRAYKWQIGGSGSFPNVQPSGGGTTFSTTGGSAVYGASPNNTYMAGMATPATGGLPPKPMRWNSGTPADLTAAGADFSSGQARGVDYSGLTVGRVDSGSLKRGFRTSSGAILTAHTLLPYIECTSGSCDYSSQDWNSSAYGIVPKVSGSSSYADYTVGSAKWLKWENGGWVSKKLEMAAFWITGSDQAKKIGLIDETSNAASRALAINDAGEVVGWSGTSEWSGSGSVTSAAFVSRGVSIYGASPPVSLNDKHFVHGLAGWNLAVAQGINNQGWIVGFGSKDGLTRGFLLRKLQP